MSLTDYLPGNERDGKIGDFQRALAPAEAILNYVSDIATQLDPRKATWGLSSWEEAYGIPVEPNKEIDFRRSRVISALRGAGTTTVAAIQNVAESFSNGTVEVVEHPDEYRIEIKFTSIIGTPPNMGDLTAALDGMMPAHVGYSYSYRYRTHGELHNHTNGVLEGYTYAQLRSRGEIANGD